MPFELSKFDKWQDAVTAYTNKSCQVLSADVSALSLARQQLADPNDHIILPEIAARHMVGPAVRQGDEDWFSIVRWTIYALIAAEELGITSANVDAMRGLAERGGAPLSRCRHGFRPAARPRRRLDAAHDQAGRQLRRDFRAPPRAKSPLKLERRLNNLATNGGLHYAPSFR